MPNRSRRDGGREPAAQGRRGGALDQHGHELAGRGVAAEVHRRVATRPPAQHRGVGAARALHEHLLDPAHALLVPRVRASLHDVDQPLDPLALDLLGHLVGHRGRVGALARRVDEGERTVEPDLLDDGERLPEVRLGLAGEADDQIGREREVGDRRRAAPRRAAGSARRRRCAASP